MTRKALSEYPNVDAIYFQGALLDPIPILEKLEHELKLPIVASNPAMLWLILSKLGLQYNIARLRQTAGIVAHRARRSVLIPATSATITTRLSRPRPHAGHLLHQSHGRTPLRRHVEVVQI